MRRPPGKGRRSLISCNRQLAALNTVFGNEVTMGIHGDPPVPPQDSRSSPAGTVEPLIPKPLLPPSGGNSPCSVVHSPARPGPWAALQHEIPAEVDKMSWREAAFSPSSLGGGTQD